MMARRRTSSLRMVLLLILITFVWLHLQFHILNLGSSSVSDAAFEMNDSAIFSMVPPVLHKFFTTRLKNVTAELNSSAIAGNSDFPLPLNITEILRIITHYNKLQQVYNEDIYGPIQNDTVVIVIQVHTRITYLRHLIVSLAQVRNISKALVVFSHDYYDEELNELVKSVDFCKVMQIFYPYSIQTHPNVFPGEDPNDCPRDMKKEESLIRKCNNALYPDLYGHYREAKFTQIKHHWWWKANRVFNQLEITRHHTGMVVFLEEDHYVAEDILHVLKLMEKTSKKICDKCNILSLGTYLKRCNYYGDSNKVEITKWVGSKHNMGMALNRSTWLEIMKCSEQFCKYDDYNWDWTLQHISQTCLVHKLHAMVVRGPRVFHIGECGVHQKKNNCASTAMISKVQQVLKIANKQLYPSYLILPFTSKINIKHKLWFKQWVQSTELEHIQQENGGWGDPRDHMLCINVTYTNR